jgi:hypothetical protein
MRGSIELLAVADESSPPANRRRCRHDRRIAGGDAAVCSADNVARLRGKFGFSRRPRRRLLMHALGNLPASLIVGAFNTCPDPDSQSNDSQFLKHFRKKMNCGSETNQACRCRILRFSGGAITRELRL